MKTITTPNEYGDGISCYEQGKKYTIKNKIVDFTDLPIDAYDGGIDMVEGATVTIDSCIVRNVGKAILCGTGDSVAVSKVVIKDSIIEGCGRRCPEAQSGVEVTLERCIIRNWGRTFSVRSFGAWAHNGGSITAIDCIFWQDSFFSKNFFKDLVGHIGQAWNDKSTRLRDWWMPGCCRGLTAGPDGKVFARNCYANKWWIQIENHLDPIQEKEANEIMEQIYAKCNKAS